MLLQLPAERCAEWWLLGRAIQSHVGRTDDRTTHRPGCRDEPLSCQLQGTASKPWKLCWSLGCAELCGASAPAGTRPAGLPLHSICCPHGNGAGGKRAPEPGPQHLRPCRGWCPVPQLHGRGCWHGLHLPLRALAAGAFSPLSVPWAGGAPNRAALLACKKGSHSFTC